MARERERTEESPNGPPQIYHAFHVWQAAARARSNTDTPPEWTWHLGLRPSGTIISLSKGF
ncbi:uncharacterized protein P884DRAFT_120618 [Thermothelomyces heterothallicus CBS 202.75]|uniref:uncharacterized protein n=1 Tax=Thermothelomyces heterothallicus CBS 202.75 TaxID=1149848 RepID=UPI003744234A